MFFFVVVVVVVFFDFSVEIDSNSIGANVFFVALRV